MLTHTSPTFVCKSRDIVRSLCLLMVLLDYRGCPNLREVLINASVELRETVVGLLFLQVRYEILKKCKLIRSSPGWTTHWLRHRV